MTTYTGTPRTWAAAEKVTAALLNAEVRDPLTALSGAWNSYTPTLGGFTAGNGVATGAYLQFGKLVIFRASFTFGSTSAAATALPTLSLPVTAAATAAGWPITGQFLDITSAYYAAHAYLSSTTVASLGIVGTSGAVGIPTTTTPFTWATNDSIAVFGIYEAA